VILLEMRSAENALHQASVYDVVLLSAREGITSSQIAEMWAEGLNPELTPSPGRMISILRRGGLKCEAGSGVVRRGTV